MRVSNFAVIVLAARQSHVKTCSERLPFNFDQSPEKISTTSNKTFSSRNSRVVTRRANDLPVSRTDYVWQSRRLDCVDSDTNAIASSYLDYLVCPGGVGVSARPVRPYEVLVRSNFLFETSLQRLLSSNCTI
jgi:hypothetical protein